MFRSRISVTLPIIIGGLSIVSSTTVAYQAYSHAADLLHHIAGPQVSQEILNDGLSQLKYSIGGTVLAVVMVTQICGQLYASNISRRLRNIVNAMLDLRNGNNRVPVPHMDSKDEIGDLASVLQTFKEAAIRVAVMSNEQQEAQQRIETRTEQMESLIKSFDSQMENALSQLMHSTTATQRMARSMVTVAELTNTRTESVVSASDETANNVRAVAAAAEELSASIAEVTHQVSRSTQISHNAVLSTQEADKTVHELEKAASKIGDVSALISDIASQINMLALNATIESARAGEAGKGFAVVASEVKALASQTTKATQEIAAQIQSIQDVAGDVVEVLMGIRRTINEMSDIAKAIFNSVDQQGAATREIAANMSTAALIVQEVTDHSIAVKDASVEVDSSAKNVLKASETMASSSRSMRSEIEHFLKEIRAV